MVTDQIADLLTRIRNAQKAGHPTVSVPASKSKVRLLDVLKAEGFIEEFEKVKDSGEKDQLKIFLRYSSGAKPVIREIRRLSRPGKRLYVAKDNIPRCRGGLGLVVVSTPMGMLSDREARKAGVGGELICSVF